MHHEDLDAVDVQVLVQEPYELLALLGGDAACAAVRDLAGLVPGREVYAGGQVALAQGEADAEGGEHAAADLEAQGVVAEEAEVAGATPRAHPRGDGAREPEVGASGEGVEVRGVRGFELRRAGRVHRQASQAVQDEQDYLRVRLD